MFVPDATNICFGPVCSYLHESEGEKFKTNYIKGKKKEPRETENVYHALDQKQNFQHLIKFIK